MPRFVNNAAFVATSGGTSSFTVSAALTGYVTPAAAGVADTVTYRYRAQSADMTEWEWGDTVASSTGTVFSRVVRGSSNGGSAVNFTVAPNVILTFIAEDMVVPRFPQGRLTLATNTPIMSSAQTAKTTIYYTPYIGGTIPLYDGASFIDTPFTELSVATTDTSKNPAAIGASKVNDWFVWNDAGTIRLSHGPDWTSDTARSAGTGLTRVNGILLNDTAITNGPGAQRGTYVGTTRSNSSSLLNFTLGGSSAGGTEALLNVWNMYNRVIVGAHVTDNTASWNYSTNTTRPINNSTGNRVSFVCGLAEDPVQVSLNARGASNVNSGQLVTGFQLDGTTVFDKAWLTLVAVAGEQSSMCVQHNYPPQLGYHYVQALENSSAALSLTFVGGIYQGLNATIRM